MRERDGGFVVIRRIRFDWEGSEKKMLRLVKSNYVGGGEEVS